jgi:hypothetical protein
MLYARQSSIEIIDDIFDGLGMRDDPENYSIGFRQPFFVDEDDEQAYAISVGIKRASSSLFGQGFSFSPGAADGERRVSALRQALNGIDGRWIKSFGVRSVVSVGLRIMGATQST